MDSKTEIINLEKLAERKEQEWRHVQNLRLTTLSQDLEKKENLLTLEKTRFRKLKDDFEYNLKIIEERDAELLKYEAFLKGIKEREKSRLSQISDAKIELENAKEKAGQALTEKIELQRHYESRVKDMRDQMNRYYAQKNSEYSKEKEEYVKFKRNAERQIQNATDEMEAQKRQLMFEFDEHSKKQDSEHKIKLDEMNNIIHSKELRMKMLVKELELCRENATKRVEEQTNLSDEIIELKKQFKKKDWELKDAENMAAIKLLEAKQNADDLAKENSRLSGEFLRRFAEMNKCSKAKEHQLGTLREASASKETELHAIIDTLKNIILGGENKLKQTIWDFNDRLKERDLVVKSLQLSLEENRTKAKHDQKNVSKALVARDLEIENLRESGNKLNCNADVLAIQLKKAQNQLKLSLEREKMLEQAKAQHELDWQRRYEDAAKSSEEKCNNFVRKLDDKLKTSALELQAKEKELSQREHLVRVLKTDKDIAYNLLKKNGIDIAMFSKDFCEMIPKCELDGSLEQNERLKDVIRQMRLEIESIVQKHKRDLKLSSVEYATDLESQVQILKQERRKMLSDIDDLEEKIQKVEKQKYAILSRDTEHGNKGTKMYDSSNAKLEIKLRSAVKQIQTLSRDRDQLIKIGNKLRAELGHLKMQQKDREDFKMNSLKAMQGEYQSKLDNLEQLQYKLTMDQMRDQPITEENIEVKMQSSSENSDASIDYEIAKEDYKEQQLTAREGISQETNTIQKEGAAFQPADFHVSKDSEDSSLHQQNINIASSSELSSLHDLWRLLDESESLVAPTPRTSSRRTSRKLENTLEDLDPPVRDEPRVDLTVKRVEDVGISGQQMQLVQKEGPKQPALSKRAKGQYVTPIKKPSIRNYNKKE